MTAALAPSGYRSPDVCRIARVTYRQLDHLDRVHGLGPSLTVASGPGTQRLYTRADIAALLAWSELRRLGVESPIAVRAVLDLRDRGAFDLDPLYHPIVLREGVPPDMDPTLEPLTSAVVAWPPWDRLDGCS